MKTSRHRKFKKRIQPTNDELVAFVNDEWVKKRRNAAKSKIRRQAVQVHRQNKRASNTVQEATKLLKGNKYGLVQRSKPHDVICFVFENWNSINLW